MKDVLVCAPELNGEAFFRDTYKNALASVGLNFTIATPSSQLDVMNTTRDYAGLVLVGGSDIESIHYNRRPHKKAQTPDKLRDSFELEITKLFILAGLPIIGICRGAQLMNVAAGGTLIQDLGSLKRFCREKHTMDKAVYDDLRKPQCQHPINLKLNTQLRDIFKNETITVPSLHHQAVSKWNLRKIPKRIRFIASAFSNLGVVEAIERQDKQIFQIGVQGHFEAMPELARQLFSAFATAIRRNQASE